VTTIEELTKHKYLKREVNGPSVCSKESFRADPAVGENNHACSYVCQCFVFHFILSPMLIILFITIQDMTNNVYVLWPKSLTLLFVHQSILVVSELP
jgi:hypothetical protein